MLRRPSNVLLLSAGTQCNGSQVVFIGSESLQTSTTVRLLCQSQVATGLRNGLGPVSRGTDRGRGLSSRTL